MSYEAMTGKKQLLLSMLEDFDEFAKKHHLTYTIDSGTALGAVRHGGFIPWDDDLDIAMPIEECFKLKRKWKQNGCRQKYYLQSKASDPYLPNPFWRIRKNGTTGIEKDATHIPMHWGIPIDIFPYYHSPKSVFWKRIIRKLHGLSMKYCRYGYDHFEASRISKTFFYLYTLFLLQAMRAISGCCKNSPFLFYPFTWSDEVFLEKKVILPPGRITFEHLMLPCPRDLDTYLTWEYGDYMTPPPEEQREGHSSALIDLENDYYAYLKPQKVCHKTKKRRK